LHDFTDRELNQEEIIKVQGFSSDYPTARLDVAERYPGTCEWILGHSDFTTWNSPQGTSSPLWISGQPGMGKTVMSKFLLEYFERDVAPVHRTVYFFFSNQDENRKTAVAFLNAIIHQLIQLSPQLYRKYVASRLAAFGDAIHSSFGLLWDIFLAMARDPCVGPVFCALDALDECDIKSRKDLISCIGRHFSPPQVSGQASPMPKHFKFIITSRPYEDILANWSRFHIIHLRAELEDPLVNKDISLFVNSEVERLAKFRAYSKELRAQVQEALIRGADGMFLWAVLMIKVLESTPIARVSDRLGKLPKGIDALYDRILAEIPEESCDTIFAILKWVVFAFQPLTVEELGIACALEASEYPSLASIPLDIRNGIIGDLAICGTILKIKGDSVHLVHQTTKEYLVRRSATDTTFERLMLSPDQANSQITLTCLSYFQFPELDQINNVRRLIEISPQFPFLRYAFSYWGSHLRQSGPVSEGEPLFGRLSAVLDSEQRRNFLYSSSQGFDSQGLGSQVFLSDRMSQDKTNTTKCTSLHLLLDIDCELISQLFARTGRFRASTKDVFGRTLLHMAAQRGFVGVVEALLETDIEAVHLVQELSLEGMGRGRSSRRYSRSWASTALHLAVTGGHQATVSLLLRSGASPDAEAMETEYFEINSFGGTRVRRSRRALHVATAGNDIAVVRLLLDSNAEIDALETRDDHTSKFGNTSARIHEEWTALHIAASLGYNEIVRELLSRGARTVTEDRGFLTAPYEVTLEGSEMAREAYGAIPDWKRGRVQLGAHLRSIVT